jgi:hypothetical protein
VGGSESGKQYQYTPRNIFQKHFVGGKPEARGKELGTLLWKGFLFECPRLNTIHKLLSNQKP